MTKLHWIALLGFLPIEVFACFDGRQYDVSSERSKIAIAVTLLLAVLALTARYKTNKTKLFVPIIMLVLCMPYPIITGFRSYNICCDCGFGFLEATYWGVLGAFLIFIYEAYQFAKTKKAT
jgi:hypothetical protein